MMSDKQKPLVPEDRSLDDRAYDLFGEMLLQQETAALLAEIEAEKARGDTAEMDAFFAKQDAKNLDVIQRHFRRHRARVFFRETLPRIGQIAAIVIAVVAVAGSVAIATSHTLRVQVMQLLVNIEEEYTELKLQEDPAASFDIPAEWGGENYPSFIPDSMVAGMVFSYPDSNSVELIDKRTGAVKGQFSEYGADTEVNIDSEDAVQEPVMIGLNAGYLVKKGNRLSLYWDNGRKYFILMVSDLEKDATVRIAESIVRIK
jgi:hypothetical protein